MVTMAKYDKLHKGMNYEEVCEILGSPGELISSETAQIEPGIVTFAIQTIAGRFSTCSMPSFPMQLRTTPSR